MIITFKTLQQKTFKIEIEETVKVRALKEKIAVEKGSEFPVEGQKLIYAGKILDDDKTIAEYNIDTVKNFVVVMAVKPKLKATEKTAEDSPSPAPTTTPSASAPASDTTTISTTTTATSTTSETSTAPASETTTTVGTTTTTATTTTTDSSQANVQSAESALLTGSALETSITELMSLGFSREQVMRALQSSFHNADRAAEYLLSGQIPDIPPDEGGDVPASEETGDSNPASGGGGREAEIPADIAFLANLPQFQLMRNQVRQHPESLPQLLQEIGQSNPQLLQLISQNQQGFIDLLNASDDAGSGGEGGTPAAGQVRQGGDQGGGGFQIQVTPAEKDAIDRIVSMGFPEPEVIQAFFACEKNEQLTINFLLSQ